MDSRSLLSLATVTLAVVSVLGPSSLRGSQDIAPALSEARDTVVVQLPYYHSFNFAGFYAAQAKGFYAEEGLVVVVQEAEPVGVRPIDRVLSGEADFGVAGSDLVAARLRGRPVVVLAAIQQRSPWALATLESSGIESLEDIRGRRVATSEDGGHGQLLAMLDAVGVGLNDIELVSPAEDIDVLNGSADADAIYLKHPPFDLDEEGEEYRLFKPSDYGFDFYGDGIFTSAELVEDRPALVEAFRRATLRGWEYAFENPDEIIDRVLEQGSGLEHARSRGFLESEARAVADLAEPGVLPFGDSNPLRWQGIARTYLELGLVGAHGGLGSFVYRPGARLDPERKITQYVATWWGTEDGLEHPTIIDIAQTPDGYLWLATRGGVVRFDGVRFETVLNTATSALLTNNLVNALMVDRTGTLWIGTQENGVLRMNNNEIGALTESEGLASNRVLSLLECANGTILIGGPGVVTEVSGSAVMQVPLPVADDSPVRAIAEDAFGNVWIAVQDHGVVAYNGSTSRLFPDVDALGPRPGRTVFVARNGDILLGNLTGGVSTIRAGSAFAMQGAADLPQVREIHQDRNDDYWLATVNGLTRIGDHGTETLLDAPLTDARVYAIHEDPEGSLWVGTYSGLLRLRDGPVAQFGTPEGFPPDVPHTVLVDRSGLLWVGGGGGLMSFDGKQAQPYRSASGPTRVHSILQARDRAGSIWIGSDQGLQTLRSNQVVAATGADGLRTGDVTVVVEDPHEDGTLWLGTLDRGVFRYRGGRLDQPLSDRRLDGNRIRWMHVDSTEAVWVLTSSAGLIRFDDGQTQQWDRARGLSTDELTTAYVDSKGVVWVGTFGGGLNRIEGDDVTVFGRADGLFDDSQWTLFEDEESRLWMGSDLGVWFVPKDSLDAFARGEVASVHSTFYGAGEGLRAHETNWGGFPAVARGPDGAMWYPTSDGVASVNTNRSNVNSYAPRPVVQLVVAGSDSLDAMPTMILPLGARSLEFRYSGLGLRESENITFRYRLADHDEEWIEAGTRRSAFYTDLQPGEQTFQVTAFNEDGISTRVPATVAITIPPFYYETATFKAFLAFLVVLGLLGANRLQMSRARTRTTRLRKEVQQRKSTEVALRQSEERFRSLVQDAPEAIVLLETEKGVPLGANRSAEILFGLLEEELVERAFSSLGWTDVDSNEIRSHLIEASDREVGPLEWSLVSESDSEAFCEIRLVPFPDANRQLVRATITDISARKANEEALQQALAELHQLQERLEAENVYLWEEIRLEHGFEEIVGESVALKAALAQIEQVAPTDATVMVLGETGTGKELVARAIHGLSDRSQRPLVKVNCAALPQNLIESELFGHEKGAFTGANGRKIGRFELADGGTLFLDEVGELPLEAQSKLLRVLQEGELQRVGGERPIHVDVRVIAATNRDLTTGVKEGRFREDLYYRLNVFPLHIPPLRERGDDVELLARHFLQKYAMRFGKEITTIPGSVMARLRSYDWPGNVRELENVIERAAILNEGPELRLVAQQQRTLRSAPDRRLGSAATTASTEPKVSLPKPRRRRPGRGAANPNRERSDVLNALERNDWVIKRAAADLGVSRPTLYRRIEEYQLKREAR